MADRRMIHRAVICSDEFIDMSHEAQALFFQLQIEADAYGLLASVKKIMRTIGVNDTSLQELVGAGFVISFGNGVIALSHWNVANTRKNDRTEKAHFPIELARLYEDENKVYHLAEDNGIQLEDNGIQLEDNVAQNSIAQRSPAKPSKAQYSGEEESERGETAESVCERYILTQIKQVDRQELSRLLNNGKAQELSNAAYYAYIDNKPWWSEVKKRLR